MSLSENSVYLKKNNDLIDKITDVAGKLVFNMSQTTHIPRFYHEIIGNLATLDNRLKELTDRTVENNNEFSKAFDKIMIDLSEIKSAVSKYIKKPKKSAVTLRYYEDVIKGIDDLEKHLTAFKDNVVLNNQKHNPNSWANEEIKKLSEDYNKIVEQNENIKTPLPKIFTNLQEIAQFNAEKNNVQHARITNVLHRSVDLLKVITKSEGIDPRVVLEEFLNSVSDLDKDESVSKSIKQTLNKVAFDIVDYILNLKPNLINKVAGRLADFFLSPILVDKDLKIILQEWQKNFSVKIQLAEVISYAKNPDKLGALTLAVEAAERYESTKKTDNQSQNVQDVEEKNDEVLRTKVSI